MGATYAAFQYLVVQRVAKKIKPENMVRFGLIVAGCAVIAVDFVHSVTQLHAVITVFVMSMGFVLPGLITCLSNLASQDDQGHMMGMVSSVQAIATVLMMLVGGYLDNYGIAVSVVMGGALLLISWLLFVTYFKPKKSNVSESVA